MMDMGLAMTLAVGMAVAVDTAMAITMRPIQGQGMALEAILIV